MIGLAEHASQRLALCAQKALLYEVSVTPKPGLVDRAGSGAHRDMDFYSFLDSAAALLPYFERCAACGEEAAERRREQTGRQGQAPEDAWLQDLLPALRQYGILAEQAMLRATGGVNTHKGAIFLLGLLTAAAGICRSQENRTEEDVLDTAARIAAPALGDFSDASLKQTAGLAQQKQYGLGGIRQEAAAGFPSIRNTALPVLKKALAAGKSINDAGVEAILQLILMVDDSTLIKRCGSPEAVQAERDRLRALLEKMTPLQAAEVLDADWSARGISAGGCADLLGGAFFLLFQQEEM